MKDKPKSKLKPNAIYLGDNGRSMCDDSHCAGATASLTGRDLSGQKLHKVTKADLDFWLEDVGEPWSCDCGKVTLGAKK
jgi:hypothetical protein